jgi:hypothetical protein
VRSGHRNRASAAVAVTVVLALLLPLVAARATEAKPPQRYWGAWIGSQLTGTEAPWDLHALDSFEKTAGRGLSLVEFSSPFADCHGSRCLTYGFPTAQMQRIRSYGAIPVFSWGSSSLAGGIDVPAFQLRDLIAGHWDGYIRRFAREARDWGHPFFLRFDWEMDGDWFAWGAEVNGNRAGEYVTAWRHVHDLFESVGARNATWVWCPYARGDPLHRYYPGARYVDWTGLDGFDWGPHSPEPAPRLSFREIFAPAYRQIGQFAPHKPMLLAEVASNGTGKHKTQWIRGMFAALGKGFSRVRGLIWFDKIDGSAIWPIEGARGPTRAFRRGIRRGYAANVYSKLRGGAVRPPRGASH